MHKNNKYFTSHQKEFYEKYIKRPQDSIRTLLILIVLSPTLLIVMILVRVKLGVPMLFKQKRPGLNGEISALYKFRTVTNERDADDNLLPDEEHFTLFRMQVRRLNIDGLPGIRNIFSRTLSVVGSRPLLVSYLSLYSGQRTRRHEIGPSLTGYTQVHGRDSITWEDKLDKDVYYVGYTTFIRDWEIVLQTVKTVLKREGIHSRTAVTMGFFTGTPNHISEEGAND